MRRAAFVSLAVGLCIRGIAWAGAGALDPSFGTGGAVVAALSTNNDEGDVVVVQPDGKILVGGQGLSTSHAFVARYDASGVLDPTFGTGGIVDILDPSVVSALVLDPDGKIIVMGPSGIGMLLARLLPDGTLDATFGTGGLVEAGIDVGYDRAGGLVLQPDLKIVAGGTQFNSNFALARFLPNGSVDSAFGAFGIAVAAIGTDEVAELFDLVLQPDGMLVAGGIATSNGHDDFALARFQSNGQLDPTFGTGGTKLQTVFGANSDEGIDALVLQSDGKIVAVGNPTSGLSAYIVARFTTSGMLDTTFAGTGTQIFGIDGSDFPEDLAISPTGRIIVAGESQGLLTLARIRTDGLLDDTFGPNGNGLARYDDPPIGACCSHLHAVALQPDGRIVAAGYTAPDYFTSGFDLAVIRVFGGECGNAVVEAGEDCELANSCCSATCTFRSAGSSCTDDGLMCTRDVCDATGGCTHPGNIRVGCTASAVPGGTKLAIRDDARDALVWRWGKGPSIAPGALGDPIGSTSYALCGFSGSSLLFQLDAPAGGTCAGQPCWRARGTSGFGYRDPAATPSGTTVLTAVGGLSNRSRAVVKGKGANLSVAPLPLSTPVRVQLQATNGFCIDSTFSQPLRNDARQFRAKSD